jgi:hypothetical protein
MSQQYRLIVHCDENASSACVGFAEYAALDRIGLARQSDRFGSEAGWLRGYGAKNTYDVCPACRPTVEKRVRVEHLATPVESPVETAGRNDG